MRGRIIASLALVFLNALVTRATVTGTISGVVTDPSGAVIPGVAVKAVNTSTAIERATVTNTQGFYALPDLSVGTYEVSFHKEGFVDVRKTGVVIDVNTEFRLDAALQVGGGQGGGHDFQQRGAIGNHPDGDGRGYRRYAHDRDAA